MNGEPVYEGCHLTRGAASVTIVADYNSGSWTFDYSADAGPAAAADTFSVSVGKCLRNPVNAADTQRLVSVSMTNTADAGGRSIPELIVRTFQGGDQRNVFADNTIVRRLVDGQLATSDLFGRNADGSPDTVTGMNSGEMWTIKVFRSDGGRLYPVFTQDLYLPSCQLARVKRGYSKTNVTITAHDCWGAPSDRRFRIRLLNKRGKTVYRQAVPMVTGQTRTVVLKKSAAPKRVLARGIPEFVVEQYDLHTIYDYRDDLPTTHWGADYGAAGVPVWKARRR